MTSAGTIISLEIIILYEVYNTFSGGENFIGQIMLFFKV